MKPGFPAHEFDITVPFLPTDGLGMGALDGFRRLEHSGFEAEGLADEVDMVVSSF